MVTLNFGYALTLSSEVAESRILKAVNGILALTSKFLTDEVGDFP